MIGQVPLGEKVLPLLRCSPEDQTSHSHLGAALWVYGAAWVQWLFRCLSEAVASVAVGGVAKGTFRDGGGEVFGADAAAENIAGIGVVGPKNAFFM